MNKEEPLIILGSARKHGDTQKLLTSVFTEESYTLIDLLDWPVAPYSYTQLYPATDTFLTLAHQLLQHRVIVLATPVYWYSMSALLKTFFDRLTDLTTTHKRLGRQLAGRQVFLLASGSDPELPAGFEVPFQRTAYYFDMVFAGSLYQATKQPLNEAAMHHFRRRLSAV